MFERYTEKARRVVFFARYEASQFGSPYIESEQLAPGNRPGRQSTNQSVFALRDNIHSTASGEPDHYTGEDFYFCRPSSEHRIEKCVGVCGRGSGAPRPQIYRHGASAAWLVARGKMLGRTDVDGTGCTVEPGP